MINVLLDTDVLIPGLISSRTLGHARLERHVSPPNTDWLVAWIARVAVVHPDPIVIEPVTRDPDDDYLFALGRDAHVDAIVSGDADLTEIDAPPIVVMTPRAFLDFLHSQG